MSVAIAAGMALGVFSKLVDYVAPAWAGNSFALWLLIAFLVGLAARSWRDAAARGTASLVVANCTYYALRLFALDNVTPRFALRAFAFWMLLAVPAGFVSGALAGRGRAGLALAAGGFAGEAAFTATAGGRPLRVAITALVAAVLVAWTSWTRPGVWIAGGGAVAVAGAMALRRLVLA